MSLQSAYQKLLRSIRRRVWFLRTKLFSLGPSLVTGDVVALAHTIKTFPKMSEEDLSAMKLAAAEAARNLYSTKHYSDAFEKALRS